VTAAPPTRVVMLSKSDVVSIVSPVPGPRAVSAPGRLLLAAWLALALAAAAAAAAAAVPPAGPTMAASSRWVDAYKRLPTARASSPSSPASACACSAAARVSTVCARGGCGEGGAVTLVRARGVSLAWPRRC